MRLAGSTHHWLCLQLAEKFCSTSTGSFTVCRIHHWLCRVRGVRGANPARHCLHGVTRANCAPALSPSERQRLGTQEPPRRQRKEPWRDKKYGARAAGNRDAKAEAEEGEAQQATPGSAAAQGYWRGQTCLEALGLRGLGGGGDTVTPEERLLHPGCM